VEGVWQQDVGTAGRRSRRLEEGTAMAAPQTGSDDDLSYWRALAEVRGEVIQALHEFNYWHESSVARGEVIAGLEKSVALWRARCESAEARLAAPAVGLPTPAVLAGRATRRARGTLSALRAGGR
jgi:hypothetical protein